MSAPNVARLERAGSLETVSVATLRRYLRAIGYDLQIVATPLRGAPDDAVDVVDPADADDPTDA